jgi:hypothetical protein
VTLNADGTFTGVAGVAGTFSFTVKVCDPDSACTLQNVTITVAAAAMRIPMPRPDRTLPATNTDATDNGPSGAVLMTGLLLILLAGSLAVNPRRLPRKG